MNNSENITRPLADRMRPRVLQEFIGQQHLLGPGKPLRVAIETGQLHSMVFWGPPGTGKTTLARMLAKQTDAEFVAISAVLAGVKDIRAAVDSAKARKEVYGKGTILFVDEAHRFNKAQQDAFLPFVEDGTLLFVGATTENPSFELNNALLSRARTYVLKRLEDNDLCEMLQAALEDEDRGLGAEKIEIAAVLLERIAQAADGDGRRALNLLEIASDLAQQNGDGKQISEAAIHEIISGGVRRFDKGGEVFYDQISALHKAVRGSDPDASLYWFTRMLDGGCDPLYMARRIVRMASEDIGNADPRALDLAMNAWSAQERLGSPEGELALAQAVVYLAVAPKSNAVYNAYKTASSDAQKMGSLEVPLHLRNAPTKLMKEIGYGKEYRYAHDEPEGYAAGENYFPEEMQARKYYQPVSRGLEIKIKERLDHLRTLDRQAANKKK